MFREPRGALRARSPDAWNLWLKRRVVKDNNPVLLDVGRAH